MYEKKRNSSVRLALSVAFLFVLAACGGGGSSVGSKPPPVQTPPTPNAGQFALNGIDQIPQSMLKLSKKEMQSKWVVAESDIEHAREVGKVACQSYAVDSAQCAYTDHTGKHRDSNGTVTSRTGGTTPFTMLLDENFAANNAVDNSWFKQEAVNMGAKIVNYSQGGRYAAFTAVGDGGPPYSTLPYLIIHSAGNDHTNDSWYDIGTPAEKAKIDAAVTADKLLFVAGWDKDAAGNYIRHSASSSCKATGNKLDSACLWAQYEFPGIGNGTSYSAPQVSAALASVLAVFPDTTPQNLAKFGKACARRSGNGIETLLRVSGGIGVADFGCMGGVISALRNLPTGGTTNVSVNGQSVAVSGRNLSLGFAEGLSILTDGEDGSSFYPVRNGEKGILFVGQHRYGSLFASAAVGTRDDFFGFTEEHERVFESRVSAGGENLFVTLSEQYSSGGDVIDSARGRSLALVARERFSLTDETSLTVSARADRFLGGSADIPVGSVPLNRGGWEYGLSLASETALRDNVTLGFSAGVRSPRGSGEELTLGTDLNWRF